MGSTAIPDRIEGGTYLIAGALTGAMSPDHLPSPTRAPLLEALTGCGRR
jgi:UDP-N-acetylglucosamine enolpyruvyl transferase